MTDAAKKLALVEPVQDTKTEVTPEYEYSVGNNKARIKATDLVNTSQITLPNGVTFTDKDGKKKRSGYLSYSAADLYLHRCQKQFEFRHVLKTRPRLTPKSRMWAGSAVHSANDLVLKAKIEGKKIRREDYLGNIVEYLDSEIKKYKLDFEKEKIEGRDPAELSFGSRIDNESQLYDLFTNVAAVFYDKHLDEVKPKAVEDLFVHHFEVDSGGTIPIVGFIDLIEEYNGELMVTDHKTGQKWTDLDVKTNQQLVLYSMVKQIPNVSINNFVLGTTGGKKGNGKPGEFLKIPAKMTIKDYAKTHKDINLFLKGLKAGIFARTGMGNDIVCSPEQCPYWKECQE